jgi:hypothetical protein
MTSDKIEDRDIKEVNLSHKEIDVQAKSTATISTDMTTLGADYVKVLLDVQCRMCTFLFFKRHIIPRQSEKDGKILMEGYTMRVSWKSKCLLKRHLL